MKKTRIRLFPKIKARRGNLKIEGDKGQRYCPNCHYPLPHYGEFCSNCGQRYTDGKVSLKYLLEDFFDNVLNIDSKFLRTVWSLAIPGKLTNEFFQGHQKRYASPGRLFFVATVVHFAVLGFVLNDAIDNEFGNNMEENKREVYERPLRDSLEAARLLVEGQFSSSPNVQQAIDTLFNHIEKAKRDSMGFGYPYMNDNWTITVKEIKLSKEDLYGKSPAQLAEKQQITDKVESFIFQRVVKLQTEANNFGHFMLGQLVWMVVLMMPALAFILKLLYFRRKRFFVEHLVFSFHYHAFAFWAVTITILIMYWTEALDNATAATLVPNLVLLGIMIYLFVAMRRVYKQGFLKTFIKYNILNFAYLFIFSLFLSLTFVVSTLLF